MTILKEFKEFAIRGSVIDLAVGVIIGGAFQKIVSSLVTDVITPPISLLTGGINFAERKWTMQASHAEITLNYGRFIQNIVEFVLIAFVIFLMVKGINAIRRAPAKPRKEKPTREEKLLTEIRDLIRKRQG